MSMWWMRSRPRASRATRLHRSIRGRGSAARVKGDKRHGQCPNREHKLRVCLIQFVYSSSWCIELTLSKCCGTLLFPPPRKSFSDMECVTLLASSCFNHSDNSELNIKAMRKEVFPDFKIILQFKAFHNNYEPEDTRLQISLWNNGYIFWLIS